MKIIHVAASLEDQASGVSAVVPAFAKASGEAGHDVQLFSLGPQGNLAQVGFNHLKYETDWPQVPILNKLQSSARMQTALFDPSCDIVHAHGLWAMPTIYAARTKKSGNRKLIFSPHGMLAADALRFSAWRKIVFSTLLQNRALARVDVFHATSESEVADIRRVGFKQPVALIAPGVDIPSSLEKSKQQKLRTLLYVGRIHAIKRLGDVLDAWRDLANKHPNWQLRIIGPDDTDEALRLKARITAEKLPRVFIEPALFGTAKLQAYAEADIFVLPSQSENFALVVAEALAQGLPVICSKGAPWAALLDQRCGWWVDIGSEPLRVVMNTAMQLPPAVLRQMGLRGAAWMARDFSWGAVSNKFDETYRWMADGGERPEFIKENS